MLFDIPSILFYVFAALVAFSGFMVVSSKNSVFSVFYLIFAFFNAAGLFVLLGVEYLAMTLVIVYVGAVAVLFLFVVMMLNVDFAKLREGYTRYLPIGLLVAVVLFVQIALLFYASLVSPQIVETVAQPIPDLVETSNANAIGQVLYTDYILLFQMAGIILLVAMIGAIVLTLRHRPGVKRQKIAKQVARKREEGVAVVSVKSGEGI